MSGCGCLCFWTGLGFELQVSLGLLSIARSHNIECITEISNHLEDLLPTIPTRTNMEAITEGMAVLSFSDSASTTANISSRTKFDATQNKDLVIFNGIFENSPEVTANYLRGQQHNVTVATPDHAVYAHIKPHGLPGECQLAILTCAIVKTTTGILTNVMIVTNTPFLPRGPLIVVTFAVASALCCGTRGGARATMGWTTPARVGPPRSAYDRWLHRTQGNLVIGRFQGSQGRIPRLGLHLLRS